ncbi:MAG: Ppx/GppA family phosphatase [Bacteroidetes bacterium]|jgi:exopolyphosphatase/guanosine-5'-triphosphate,3'-diphosphate pyrophosphatase|nr:Ppx/GppA family phosphatase [Bacteroidota bacterium]
MKSSAIDIGTNSVLLLVADTSDGKLRVLHEEQRLPRLGKGVDKERRLSKKSIGRTIEVLLDYRKTLTDQYPEVDERVYVTATSAARDASNRNDFLKEAYNQTGWNIRLLSGDEEAELTFRGALSVIDTDPGNHYLVLDIGGGSTEFAFGSDHSLQRALSLDMGCVRFTERFLIGSPPDQKGIKAASREIRNMISAIDIVSNESDMVGVAGTVTALAGVAMNLDSYDATRMNGYRMTRQSIEHLAEKFSKMRAGDIEKRYPLFMKGRGEVILAGLIILTDVMKWSGHESLLVSTGGIQHGLIAEKHLKIKSPE